MKIAIVGFGYWGEKLVKILLNFEKSTVGYLCIVDTDKTKKAKAYEYRLDFFNNLSEVYDRVDVCIIATWETTHYTIAKQCLLAGKHILVEKPICLNSIQLRDLLKIAKKKKLIVMQDETFLYDKSFLSLKKEIKRNNIGRLLRIDSWRFSPNIIKPYTNVIVDLFPHDLSIFYSLLRKKSMKTKISKKVFLNKNRDSAFIELKFNSCLTYSFLSWIYPETKREMIFYGKKGVLSWQKKDNKSDEIRKYFYNENKQLILKNKKTIKGKDKTLYEVMKSFFNRIRTQRSTEKILIEKSKLLESILKDI